MQSTVDSVTLQITCPYEFNKLSAVARAEFMASCIFSGTTRQRSTLVYGVGINDATYPTMTTIYGGRIRCPVYVVWLSMLKRCYSPKYQQTRPTYKGCSVAPGWHSFMKFREWWLSNYIDGYQLDKDILAPGNKVYSADTCLYVPQWLNLFTVVRNASRGELPIGVSLRKSSNNKQYQAVCSAGKGKLVHLGLYVTPEEAHGAWLDHKLRLADNMICELESILPGLHGKVRAKVLSLR